MVMALEALLIASLYNSGWGEGGGAAEATGCGLGEGGGDAVAGGEGESAASPGEVAVLSLLQATKLRVKILDRRLKERFLLKILNMSCHPSLKKARFVRFPHAPYSSKDARLRGIALKGRRHSPRLLGGAESRDERHAE
jgi:hypothetical protein